MLQFKNSNCLAFQYTIKLSVFLSFVFLSLQLQNIIIMKFISTSQLKESLSNENVLIVDIREQYERTICSINSIHIPMGEIESRFSEIPTDKNVVILCKSGRRAEAVTNFLEKEYAYTNLSVLEGGILAWIEEVDNKLETY
jgi:rhodanese-related sulfurtransferase